jgi:hypothetical protein
MKLIIKIRDDQAEKVRRFLADLDRRGRATKSIPGISLKVNNCHEGAELQCRYSDIVVEGLPHDFKVGDVVENTKSGNWGVIKEVNEDGLVITCSKETRKDSGRKTMIFQTSETAHLI